MRSKIRVVIRSFLRFTVILTIAIQSGCSDDSDPSVEQFLERGDLLIRQFYDGEYEDFRSQTSDEFKAAVSAAELEEIGTDLKAQFGEEVEVVEETVTEAQGFLYERISLFSGSTDELAFIVSFDEKFVIQGFRIVPPGFEAPSEFLDYETITPLQLPFEGDWFIVWGGRTLRQNYHAAVVDQRFAYDILQKVESKTHEGSGKKNEDYFCFDEPLYAPGAGVVVSIASEIRDNVPGELNPAQPLGNHVIIDHQNGEYSFMAHFKKGTVIVNVGDEVSAGQFLGNTGNSGNSTEPHLHYHLQNTEVLFKGEGLPVMFNNYISDGQLVTRGEPVQGEVISPNN